MALILSLYAVIQGSYLALHVLGFIVVVIGFCADMELLDKQLFHVFT